ncbi:tRNA lysidine(34) synthetase TilS [Candidatus Izimaplasma bacterium ZiA1]|uniref:tRNA lysidine(34) synthetase TilS n=1 Tax=Candidatus Izimoplasma sp. ZiA1 TaxID=2024899 RepID=UPI000BAA48B5|nr:tRNA lysidine(34) synthetase TilS [Candidatus Izimaplasma bacterium ZiA1]
MTNNLLKTIESKKYFTKNETIVLALSGGVDSMVLFDILSKSSKNLKIIVAHVNHKKRKESDYEYTSIHKLCQEMQVVFEGYEINEELSGNFHNEARKKRYNFFKSIASKHNSKKIVLAHHYDDQVETVFMRIIRGSSFSGYQGVLETRKDGFIEFVRPLIDTKKDDIYQYASSNKLIYFEDDSNKSDIYTRNRFRNSILPLLREENPQVDDKILQLSEYVSSAENILNTLTKSFIEQFSFHNMIDLKAFNTQEFIIKVKIIKYIVNKATNNNLEISNLQYKKIIKMCQNEKANSTYDLGNDFVLYKEYEYFYVDKVTLNPVINIEVNNYGEYFIDDNKSILITEKKIEQKSSNWIELCYNELVFPLKIRTRQNGDRIQLKSGSKKIKDLLIDKKIPLSKRDNIIIIEQNNEVVGIPSLRKVKHVDNCIKKIFIYEVN